jgi:hypothetical protein
MADKLGEPLKNRSHKGLRSVRISAILAYFVPMSEGQISDLAQGEILP